MADETVFQSEFIEHRLLRLGSERGDILRKTGVEPDDCLVEEFVVARQRRDIQAHHMLRDPLNVGHGRRTHRFARHQCVCACILHDDPSQPGFSLHSAMPTRL